MGCWHFNCGLLWWRPQPIDDFRLLEVILRHFHLIPVDVHGCVKNIDVTCVCILKWVCLFVRSRFIHISVYPSVSENFVLSQFFSFFFQRCWLSLSNELILLYLYCGIKSQLKVTDFRQTLTRWNRRGFFLLCFDNLAGNISFVQRLFNPLIHSESLIVRTEGETLCCLLPWVRWSTEHRLAQIGEIPWVIRTIWYWYQTPISLILAQDQRFLIFRVIHHRIMSADNFISEIYLS